MRLRSLLILMIFTFVGGDLLMGVVFNARSAKNFTDTGYGSLKLNVRRLKEPYTFTVQKTRGLENNRMDDYQPVDPSPSSKATIRPGPIEHDTPILPYVPQYPPPPSHPKNISPVESPFT
ncbi:hypothetical protein U9M48_006509 [Paspalum notatum var. saurae]|uniref:Uncharacterized protein n=1 Tax=Paspalum notatum var. saurae TaxID=547442 RepID=A0AAQ3SM97_PASNO